MRRDSGGYLLADPLRRLRLANSDVFFLPMAFVWSQKFNRRKRPVKRELGFWVLDLLILRHLAAFGGFQNLQFRRRPKSFVVQPSPALSYSAPFPTITARTVHQVKSLNWLALTGVP
jgi:hypothetical protein